MTSRGVGWADGCLVIGGECWRIVCGCLVSVADKVDECLKKG